MRAVLFDMDGTLVDSEKLWTVALERVAQELGGSLSASARSAMVGQDLHHSVALLLADLGVEGDPEGTAALLMATTHEVFADGLPWNPGARELLHAVRAAGLAAALVTATHRSLVEVALDTLGRDNFDVTVCGDEVSRNKPDPEPYLRAMDLLGLPAAACLAIEDSPSGSAAAAAAGVPVLVVPSEVAVPPGESLVIVDSLAGMGVPALQRIWADHGGRAD